MQNIRKDTPTAVQLADPEDIFALVWKTYNAMSELGLSEKTVKNYTGDGLSIILTRHYNAGTDRYSDAILNQIIAEKRLQYEQGKISRSLYQNLRKSAYWVREMHLMGGITQGKVPNWGQWEPVEIFRTILDEFCESLEHTAAETTRKAARSAVRRFLFEMEDHGFNTLEDLSQVNANRCVASFASHYAGGVGSAISCVRWFLHFLHERGLTVIDLSSSLPELVATRKMFHEGFSEAEMERLLAHPDRTTALGKRDYAMIVLAVRSGLRACDVV